ALIGGYLQDVVRAAVLGTVEIPAPRAGEVDRRGRNPWRSAIGPAVGATAVVAGIRPPGVTAAAAAGTSVGDRGRRGPCVRGAAVLLSGATGKAHCHPGQRRRRPPPPLHCTPPNPTDAQGASRPLTKHAAYQRRLRAHARYLGSAVPTNCRRSGQPRQRGGDLCDLVGSSGGRGAC